jgi:hypothetical protein
MRGRNRRAHLGGQLDVPTQALLALGRPVDERQLAPDEAHLLREVRPRPGRVELNLVAHGAADQRVHRLIAEPPQEVPEREVDGRDRVHDQPFAPVEHRRAPHLIPHLLDPLRTLTHKEAGEMALHEPARGRAPCGDADADVAGLALHLDHERAQHVEPKG